MQTNYAINLFNWRLQVVRKQAVYFGGLLLATLLLTASVVSILFGYQQQLKNNFVQQNQQQTALRQANQQLQQQINQLHQQNSFALQQPHFATTYLATTNIAEQNIFVLFIDFLSHLPLQQGRLISAAIAQPSADADYNIRLEGITPSHQEFEQLRDSFDSYFQQWNIAINSSLETFNLTQQQLEFGFRISLLRAKEKLNTKENRENRQ